ncbi:MAG: hypothetical protein AAGE80_17065 [Pseudomonadota bacterium]
MSDKDKETPDEIQDADLDEATGGKFTTVFKPMNRGATILAETATDKLGTFEETPPIGVDFKMNKLKR